MAHLRCRAQPCFSRSRAGGTTALAQSLAQFMVKGVPLVEASGLSPFFFQNYPQFAGSFNVLWTATHSLYNSLQVQVERRVRSGLTQGWSHKLSKGSNGDAGP